MLCDVCQKREALVHISGSFQLLGVSLKSKERHLCRECADAYYANTPGMNSARGLICLSDEYRERLYDMLAAQHPEAFDNSDAKACQRGSGIMRSFLRERLTKDGIELNSDGFEMLLCDFFGSHHFYRRSDDLKRKKA